MQKQKKKIDGAILRIFTKGVDCFNRRFFLFFKKHHGKKSLAIISLLAIIGGIYFQFLPGNVEGATYTWNQTSWEGGEDEGTYPDHTDNRTNWTKYSSKDSSLAAGTELELIETEASKTQTSDSDFNTGTNSDTTVNGDGDDASIGLSKPSEVSEPGMVAGPGHTCSINEEGNMYCWGYNNYGQVGDGTTDNKTSPRQVLKGEAAEGDYSGDYLANIKSVDLGYYRTCALSQNNNLYCWGYNVFGQLGDGTQSTRTTPARVLKGAAAEGDYSGNYLANIKSIATGNGYTCAVSQNNNLYCWGSNQYGKLGDGTSDGGIVSSPVRVLKGAAVEEDYSGNYLANIKSVSVGGQGSHTCAISQSNNVYCWGQNINGQLGDGTSGADTDKTSPVRVLKGTAAEGDYSGNYLANIKSVATELSHTCAVSQNNNLYCWGYNGQGQLGDGTQSTRTTPVRVLKGAAAEGDYSGNYLANVKSVSAGGDHTCAISQSNNVYCWGRNSSGQLGDGTTDHRTSPVRVLKGAAAEGDYSGDYLANVKSVAAGDYHTCAVSQNNNLYCWGENYYGRLGDGTTDNIRTSPVRTLGLGGSGFLNLGSPYASSGTFNSSVINTGQESNFSTLDFSATVPDDTTLTVDVRAGNSTDPEEGTWTEWLTNISSGGDISSLGKNQYVQYRVNLTTADTSVSPSLDEITFHYKYYEAVSSGTSNVNFGTEGNYTQEDANNGTDFSAGVIKLHDNGLNATGGTVTTSGGDTIHTFTSNGSLFVNGSGNVRALVVAGGGEGATGGGGGGGVLSDDAFPVTTQTYEITVGAGGTGMEKNGKNSVFSTLTAIGGGAGAGTWGSGYEPPAVGGSGGGGSSIGQGYLTGANGTAGQGYAGGTTPAGMAGRHPASGGGGAGHAGYAPADVSHSGAGGAGVSSAISGSTQYYGGGGAGGSSNGAVTGGGGGVGGGGNNNQAGTPNTGGGGGGGSDPTYGISVGGSGIVIVRHPTYVASLPTSQPYYVTTSDSSQIDTSAYAHITGATLTQTTPANTDIKYLISFDDRSTWKYWDGDSWETSSLDNLQTNGMSKTTIEGLSQSNWEVSGGFTPGSGTLDFAADLSTSSSSVTPELDNIEIVYSDLPAYVVSSAFNTESSLNALSKIEWTESLPDSSTNVQIQIQTAGDNAGAPGSWSGWKGPDGTSGSYFTDPTGNESMPVAFTDQNNDQWIQYKVFLSTTNTGFTPTVSDISFSYTVNAPPEVQNIAASQGADGVVTVNYEARDSDTDTGVTQNQLNITLQYCTANCSSSGSETWTDAVTVEGGGTVSGISQESWASKSLTWTAKTDYSDQYNNADFKIRVKADDSEGANRYGYGTSAIFTLDTTNPTLGAHPILIDASTSPAAITLSASDDSSLKMKVGLNADLSDVAEWSDYSSSDELALASDPDTVYVQFKDVYGNTSSIQSATTPETPTGFMSQDTSNLKISPAEYRLFIAWKMVENPTPGFASYKVYQSESSSGPWTSLVRTEADRTVNSYGDNSVVYDTHYYYKVKVTDQDGNVSFLSETVDGNANGIQDEGEGGGGTETTAPTISNVEISNINTTQATVTWNTNELSNSTVGYSTTQGVFTSETGVATMLDDASGSGQHRVVLSGLTPNATYYLQVESEDSLDNTGTDNNGGNGYSFATLSGPVISGVYISNIEGDRATIHWTTNSSSNSYVTYSINSNMTSSTEVGTSDSVTSHGVQLTGLTSGQKYYFFVESGISSDNNEENYYSFITSTDPADTTDPVISSVSSSSISDTDAVIKWSTDEGATSKVYYGTVSGSLTSYSALNTNLNFDHAVTLASLDPGATYYYRVVSVDEKNNEATSAEYSFETEETVGDSVTEISDISDPPSVLSNNKAVITFKTDNQAQCIIEYGTASETYGELPVSETSYNIDHSMHLVSLISSSKYYYQITCTDPYDNVVNSDEGDFTTTSESTIDEDSTAPEISSVSSGSITGESVTITWKTDEDTNSLVRYGITSGELTNIAGDGLIAITTDYDTAHTVVINNLTPGTKYYYTVFSYDAAGNIGESSESSFTTKSPSTLSSIKVVSTSLSEAIVTWATSKNLTSIVEYGLTEEYGEVKSSNTATDIHEVALSGLKTGVAYHLRVKGKDADNNYYSSGDYTFEPKSPPKISSSSIDSVTEHEAKIVVVTDIPTDILATYADARDSSNTGSQGKPDFVTRHELELGNLDSGTTYSYVIKITDEQGNQTTSEEKTFTTGKDENPPEIIQVKTDSALAQNDKVQSIISWSTSEPATTSFIYKEGLSGEEKEIIVSEAYSQSHIVVSTIFKTGTVYHFKVKSVDQSGNEAISSDFALLTPKKKENIVQIIVTNFQDIFGWAGVIGK